MLTKEQRLAREIAEILHDTKMIKMHERFARQYSETYLRRTLKRVLEKRGVENPAAYYTSLVQNNADDTRG